MHTLRVALLSVVALVASVAQADGPRLQSYFGAIEGNWDGKGVIQTRDAFGNPREIRYDLDARIEQASSTNPGEWNLSNRLVDSHGNVSESRGRYSVRGDDLYIQTSTGMEPVEVLESTSVALTYRIQRTDIGTGRIFVFTFHNELVPLTHRLVGHNTVETNGVVITDERYEARKR